MAQVFVTLHNDILSAPMKGGFALLDDKVSLALVENSALFDFGEMARIGPWINKQGALVLDFVFDIGLKNARCVQKGWVLLYTHFWSLWTLFFRLGIFAHPNSFFGFLVHFPSKTRFSGTLSGTMWAILAPKWGFCRGRVSNCTPPCLYCPVCCRLSHLRACLFQSFSVVARVVASPSRQAHVGCPLHSNCNSLACQPVWCLLV